MDPDSLFQSTVSQVLFLTKDQGISEEKGSTEDKVANSNSEKVPWPGAGAKLGETLLSTPA